MIYADFFKIIREKISVNQRSISVHQRLNLSQVSILSTRYSILTMYIQENFSLLNFNTFGIEARCEQFVEVASEAELRAVLTENRLPIQLIGGGSNLLFLKEFYDLIFIKNGVKGFKILENSSNTEGVVTVEIGGGESWHEFVLWAVEQDLGGVENLSLIPGTVGAAPIQNIGAYGVELKDVFVSLEAINVQTLENQCFTFDDCQFGYRDSVFKNALKGQFFITKVRFRLTRKDHKIRATYGDITKILYEINVQNPSICDISEAVISIRKSKLPDPSVIGNAGSFFKNPEVSKSTFETLKKAYPDLVAYPSVLGAKLAAGWLIEQCGWKGKRFGNVGVHERQALVIVNYGNGNGLEIKALAEKIEASVLEKFGVFLTPEVNFI